MHSGVLIAGGIAGSLLSLGTLLVIIWKRVVRPIVKIEEALPTLYEIHKEFSNNGGSTLKDRIDDIDHQVRNIRQVLNVHVEAEEVINGHIHKRISDVESTVHKREGDGIPHQRRKSDILRSDYGNPEVSGP